MPEAFEPVFMQRAFLAIVLAGINCAAIGTYVVLRRMAFMSGALTHTIVPGVVFAHLRGIGLIWGALGAGILTAVAVAWLAGRKEIREDAAVGVVLSAFFALGLLMISQANSFLDFTALLFGSIFAVTAADLILIGVVTVIVVGTLILLHKELELASLDPEHARLAGARPALLRYTVLILTALSAVSAVHIMGALLTTALLIIPASAGVLLARSVPGIMASAACVAVLGGVSGLLVSFYQEVSGGPAIVLCCAALFLLAWFWRQLRGRIKKSPGGEPGLAKGQA